MALTRRILGRAENSRLRISWAIFLPETGEYCFAGVESLGPDGPLGGVSRFNIGISRDSGVIFSALSALALFHPGLWGSRHVWFKYEGAAEPENF